MSNPIANLIEDLIKAIEDLFHHPDFESAAHDVISVANDAVAVVPEVMGDKHALLEDAVGAAVDIAQQNIIKKAAE